MIPEYLHYLLTGVMRNEYTNAKTQDWDDEFMNVLGIPKTIFGNIPSVLA